MVSTPSLTGMIFTLVICFALPAAIVTYLHRRMRIPGRAVLIGTLVFITSQMLLRIPLLRYLSGQTWYQERMVGILFPIVVLAFSAGVFEEIGRYIGFRGGLGDNLRWKDGIAFGIGHGGIEAMLIVGSTYLNNLVMSLHINRGTFTEHIAPHLGAEAEATRQLLTTTSPHLFFLAGWERLAVMILHVGLSLLVLHAVQTQKIQFLGYAILAHTAINAPAVLGPVWGLNMEIIQLLLGAIAAWALVRIMRAQREMEHPENRGV